MPHVSREWNAERHRYCIGIVYVLDQVFAPCFLLKNKRTYLCPVKQTIKGHLLKRFAETRCRLHRKIDLFRFVKTVFISTILIKKNCQFYSYCIKKGFVKVYYDGLVK